MGKDKVYIILVNYKNWEDTAECLESLFKLDYPSYQIIVVDNSEDNESVKHLINFFERKFNIWIFPENPLRDKSIPPMEDVIPYLYLEENGNKEIIPKKTNAKNKDPKVILIKAKENRGFAAGNNLGIRYALKNNDFRYVWLLNNDTVVEKDSLKNMVEYMNKNPDVGVLGSKLILYFEPEYIQVAGGGRFSKFLLRAKHFGRMSKIDDWKEETELDHVIGASMFVRKDIVERELMDEDFFMYVEETEWCTRIKKMGYRLIYFPESIVYHKESVTIGKKNPFFFYYNSRNFLYFIKKHYRLRLPSFIVYLIIRNFIFSLKYRDKNIILYSLKGFKDFLLNKKGRLVDK